MLKPGNKLAWVPLTVAFDPEYKGIVKRLSV